MLYVSMKSALFAATFTFVTQSMAHDTKAISLTCPEWEDISDSKNWDYYEDRYDKDYEDRDKKIYQKILDEKGARPQVMYGLNRDDKEILEEGHGFPLFFQGVLGVFHTGEKSAACVYKITRYIKAHLFLYPLDKQGEPINLTQWDVSLSNLSGVDIHTTKHENSIFYYSNPFHQKILPPSGVYFKFTKK